MSPGPLADPVGRLIRLPRMLIPDRVVLPVLRTRARGLRWIVRSGPFSYWVALHEAAKRRVFSEHVRPGDVVYDIGANVGSYTLLAAVLVGADGRVVAFEPAAQNLRYLRRHVEINGLTNVRVIPAAVTERGGSVGFAVHPDSSKGAIDTSGNATVRAVALDELVESGEAPPPRCLKIDVEGAEAGVLRGASRVLERDRPIVFLATHGPGVDAECRSLLHEAGYAVEQIGRRRRELLALPRG